MHKYNVKSPESKVDSQECGSQRPGQMNVAAWESCSIRTKLQLEKSKQFQSIIPQQSDYIQ